MASDITKLSAKLQKVQQLAQARFFVEVKKNLVASPFTNSVIARTKAVINQLQAGYFGGNASDDPTAIGLYARDIENEIRRNIAIFASNLTTNGSQTFDILSDEFIGVGKEGDKEGTSPIQWLIYFIDQGFEGKKLLWINKETAIEWGIKRKLGRFGAGFLMEVDEATAAKHSDKLHPQSGKPPIGIEPFTRLIVASDFEIYVVAPAVKATEVYIESLLR